MYTAIHTAMYTATPSNNSTCSGVFAAEQRSAEPSFGTVTSCRPGFGERSALSLLNDYVMKGELSFGESHFASELEGKAGIGGPYRGGLESAAVKRILLAR
jgi:hypothetical protein